MKDLQDVPPQTALRDPDRVMRLTQLGAMFPTRLSFLRSLMRRLAADDSRRRHAKLRMLEKSFHVTHPPIRLLGLWDTVSSLIRIKLRLGTIVESSRRTATTTTSGSRSPWTAP